MTTIIVVAACLLILIALAVAYHRLKAHRATIAFLGTGIVAAGTLASVILGAIELQKTAESNALAVKQHAAMVRLSQQRVAFELAREYGRLPLDDAKILLGEVASKPPPEVQALLDEDERLWSSCRTILNFFEQAALAIKSGYADELSACVLLEGPAVAFYSRLQPWIEFHRSNFKKEGVWKEYQSLYESWKGGCTPNKISRDEGDA